MEEHSGKPLAKTAFCYLGDARYNMGNSLLVGGAIMGMDVRLCAPKGFLPTDEFSKLIRDIRGSEYVSKSQFMLADS
ncbi:unnamed protein product, partial [marine sediment metagenome]